jgi:hypothetical protein
MKLDLSSSRPARSAARSLLGLSWMLLALSAGASSRLPAELMSTLANPWPPAGWSQVLDLSQVERSQPHRSEAVLRPGYFGQTLYRHISGTAQYWTANVLIQDRGDPNAAWRAVSAVRCSSRNHQGYRARECRRGDRRHGIQTLHYQVDRFYVTIQLSGPGETDYPFFTLGTNTPAATASSARATPRRGSARIAP